MRWLGRLVVTLLLASLLGTGWHLWQQWRSQLIDQKPAHAFADARLHKTFVVDDQAWLRFRLPPGTLEARIVTHANLDIHRMSSPLFEGDYGMVYRLDAGDGTVLLEQPYQHRSKRQMYLERTGGAFTPRYYYADQPLAPMNAQRLQFDLRDYPGVRSLWLRAGMLPAAISDIAVRVYVRTLDQQQLSPIDWQRFSKQKQQRLAEVSLYEEPLLDNRERLELMSGQFRPLGPEGSDYVERTLYIRDLSLLSPVEPQQQSLAEAGAERRDYRIRLPLAGQYRLQLEAQTPSQWQLRWLDPQGQPSARSLSAFTEVDEDVWELRQRLEPGWLTVSSWQAPLNPQLWLQRGQEEAPLPTEPARIRAYRLGPSSGEGVAVELSWPVDHLAGQATPLRLDFRQSLAGPARSAPPAEVGYRLLDQQDRAIKSGRFRLQFIASDRDRLDDSEGAALSEAVSRFFRLDPAVTRIALSSDRPLWVTGFSQLPDTRLEQTLPAPPQAAHSPWYMVRPDHWRQARASGDSALLQLYPQFLKVDADLEAGRYRFEALSAIGQARGRHLLEPFEGGERGLRAELLAVLYSPIPPDRPFNAELLAPLKEDWLSPQIIYLRESETPFSWRLHAPAGGDIEWSAGHSGSLELPPLPPGPQLLHLETEARGHWLMNYLAPGDGSYLKRYAYRLEAGRELQFEVDKFSWEPQLLNLSFYSEDLKGGASDLGVHLNSTRPLRQPLLDWSYPLRRYRIIPPPGGAVALLNAGAVQLAAGQRGSVKLGAELPPGRYSLRVALEQGAPGYLLAYQLHPGDYPLRRLSRTSRARQTDGETINQQGVDNDR